MHFVSRNARSVSLERYRQKFNFRNRNDLDAQEKGTREVTHVNLRVYIRSRPLVFGMYVLPCTCLRFTGCVSLTMAIHICYFLVAQPSPRVGVITHWALR